MKLEEKREEFLSRIPSWYSGSLHFISINVLGIGVVVGCVMAMKEPKWWEWLLVPALFIFANGFEWWIHRGPMHHPTKLLRILFQRHTLEHHVVFTDETMGIRSDRDLMYILFPPWFLPLILVMNLPIPILLTIFISQNLGLLFFATVLAYYLTYEWFHFVHHIPADTWIGRRKFVGKLRYHHTRHHDPAVMADGNFNVSFPLWDWLLQSILPPKNETVSGTPE